MRLGIISDIHSNLLALEASLGILKEMGVDAIYDLGDTVFGVLEPKEVLDLLRAENIPSVCGNMNRIVAQTPETLLGNATLELVKNSLSTAQVEYLAGFPKTLEVGEVLLCHGTPTSDETCLLERILATGVFLEEDAAIAAKLIGIKHKLILCGHSHISRTVLLSGGRLIVNPGSVGLPAYEHDQPIPHVMQSGSPHARCAVLTQSKHGWNVQHLLVTYDWETAARKAAQHGRPDHAGWLRTGRATQP